MAKARDTAFFCQNCGYESAKWMGQCPSCKEWNTFVEEPLAKSGSSGSKGISSGRRADTAKAPSRLNTVSVKNEDRTSTDIGELDRVLGGGIVSGSLILVGGDPGIGKSTLLLQVCRNLAANGKKVLYISGEESEKQIKLRADRIGVFSDTLYLLCETDLDTISETIRHSQPDAVVIDSIQTMSSEEVHAAPGSVSQVRESTNILLQLAKGLNITIFIVGHVTKEGMVAGPRVLEHMVDTVLYFEGDRHASYRVLRSVKNRFGSTDEIGVFEMQEHGLKEVENASSFMLDDRPENASGSVVVCAMEGTRPILLEVQALVSRTNFGFPRRQAAGVDYNRVNLLMAVLEKRAGVQVSDCDAYVNIAGGMKVSEPAIDLGIAVAIISSFRNRPADDKMVVFGEVGLSGEVRSVSMADRRVQEAMRLGFSTCVVPRGCASDIRKRDGIKVIPVSSVADVMNIL